MTGTNIYSDIATRTGGDIYIGVVGPVRTGKSTFIKQFMDTLVIPNIAEASKKDRATDELPQSASGRTIMTTEPKFIPEEAVEISLPGNAAFRVRMIDCVGYIVPSSLGYIEGDHPRMVKTPWFDKEIPFNMAAEIGTQKVISEHSTIGLVVTTDGTISDIPRSEYEDAEARVINELKEINKPFVVLLNSVAPESPQTAQLAAELCQKYDVPVKPVNCMELTQEAIKDIISGVLFEFPVKEVKVDLPGWLMSLPCEHWLRKDIGEKIKALSADLKKVRDIILSDPSLGYVVVSAPGKRAKTDTKVTDLLYAALDKVKHGHSADVAFEPVKSRFDAIISELGIGLDLTEDYDKITAALTDNATRDYVASRGEYLSAKVLAALLDWKFIDAKDFIRFDDNGNFLSEETNAYAKAMLRSVKYAVIPGFYGSTD